MKTIKEIDRKIEELKRKYFAEENPELKKLLDNAQELSSGVTKTRIMADDEYIAKMNNCYSKLTPYVTKAESRALFSEGYRKLGYASLFVAYVQNGMAQGKAKEKCLIDLKNQKELEIVTAYISDTIKGIYKALDRSISVCQSLMKSYNVQYNTN